VLQSKKRAQNARERRTVDADWSAKLLEK